MDFMIFFAISYCRHGGGDLSDSGDSPGSGEEENKKPAVEFFFILHTLYSAGGYDFSGDSLRHRQYDFCSGGTDRGGDPGIQKRKPDRGGSRRLRGCAHCGVFAETDLNNRCGAAEMTVY